MMNENNVMNTDKMLHPFFEDNSIAIAMSSSNEYVPYLSTCLQSIVDNASENKNYDIFVFESTITSDNKDILLEQIERDNIKLRFVDPSVVFEKINLHIANQYYSKECYYRLAAPLLLRNFEKILFTDADLVFNKKFDDIFDIDISGFAYAAVKCPIIQSYLNNPISDIKKYLVDILKLDNNFNYLNTGVLLINVKEFLQNDILNKCLELAVKNKYRFQEQCALSVLSSKFWMNLPLKYNYTPMNSMWSNDKVMEFMPKETKEEFLKTKKYAVVVHYPRGYTKPWLKPDEELANIWWKYARRTPFYEVILKRMMESAISCVAGSFDYKINVVRNYRKNCLKYWKYRILKHFVFGKAKYRYLYKEQQLQDKINQAK